MFCSVFKKEEHITHISKFNEASYFKKCVSQVVQLTRSCCFRINVKKPERLERIDRIHHKVTTTDDPIIRKLAKSGGNVFATDEILATLMCCTRSNYSWDIVVQKIGNLIFFDKRDESEFDLVTVSETSRDPPSDEGPSINSPRNLAMEATFINHNFPEQVSTFFVCVIFSL